MRKTKIVATLGPATDSYAVIKKLIKAGMNVARINMSHGDHAEHKMRIDLVKKAREELGVAVAILADTKGPEIRIKTFKSGKVELQEGALFTLTGEDIEGDEEKVSITYPRLVERVRIGEQVLVNDGLIELCVENIKGKNIICKVITGGELSNRKSINLPQTKIDMPYMSRVDEKDFLFGIEQDVDYFALSFVRSVEDVLIAKDFLRRHGGEDIQIISKIENRDGVDNIEKIISQCDGTMVARGDMGVEIPFEELPAIQKYMISLCYKNGKKVITATQMLESMINNPRPTRAEISDVANAIYDGTSAIMLSGETAVGKYCVDAVKTMSKIAEKTESDISYKKRFYATEPPIKSVTDAISHASVSAAFDLDAKAIVTVTKSGFTARKISRFRPATPIIAVTTSQKANYQLALNWGVYPIMGQEKETSDELFVHSIDKAIESGIAKKGDLIILTAGVPVGVSGKSNTMRIEII